MKRPALAALLALTAGCASSSAFHIAEKAEERQDYDRAVVEYSRAAKENPDKKMYRVSLERAKLRAAGAHQEHGRALLQAGQIKEALDELRLAYNLGPSESLRADLRDAEERLNTGQRSATIAQIKEAAHEKPLSGLQLGPGAKEPLGLSFRGSSLREAYQALGRVAGVNFVFDPEYRDQTISLDIRDVPFEQALASLGQAGKTFHRVVDSHVVSVIPDTSAKRREFEQQAVKTFFLSNADLKETIDLLRVVLGARRVAPLPGGNALTINDTPEKVAAAERIVDIVDKKRAEVVVDVEILEVNRTRLKEYGIELTSNVPGTEGIVGGIGLDPTKTYTLNKNPYTASNLVLSNLPGVIYRLLQQDSDTRILANPQLRTAEGQTAQARFGDQVPVPVTVFSPIATGGVSQQPITSFEYKNVGVNIDITPRVHHDGDVTLQLKLEISAVGPLFQNLPTFNSRTVNSTIRLRDGETNVLAGLISEEERISLSGTPGLASLPFLGQLFAHNRKEIKETDIVMTLTPHIVRRPELTADDLRSFLVGSDTTPLLFEVPAIPPVSAPPRRDSEAPRIEPIRPPTPAPTPTPRP